MLKRTPLEAWLLLPPLEAWLLLLTGMAVGATVAVLFAPDSGAKTRKRLGKYVRRTAEDLWEQGEEAIETATDRGKEYLSHAIAKDV